MYLVLDKQPNFQNIFEIMCSFIYCVITVQVHFYELTTMFIVITKSQQVNKNVNEQWLTVLPVQHSIKLGLSVKVTSTFLQKE